MASSFDDPQYAAQWEIQGGAGINAAAVHAQYSGAGIRVGIVDAGIRYTAADLVGQLDTAAGYDALDGDGDASQPTGDQHGTNVALIIGARANNGTGGVGAAFGATLVSYRFGTRDERSVAQEAALLALQHQVDVSNNSWSRSGEYFRDDFGSAAYAGAAAAIRNAATVGRGGLGTVFVRSAGNNGATGDDVNAHSYQNNRHSITVGASDPTGAVLPISNPGAAVLVVAPGTATSWAAARVSSTVALMLEANPGLGYRDVQTILALGARVTDAAGAGWLVNAGTGWNGGGLHVSREAGFGLVDARAAVRLAESWRAAPATEANIASARAASAGAMAVPDLGAASQGVVIGAEMLVERVEVAIDIHHARIGQLRITLVSPGGTESVLLDQLGLGRYRADDGRLVFTLGSAQFLWEQARGEWTLRVEDLASGQAGRVEHWSLTVHGAPASDDTLHVFTDEYAAQARADPGRATLRDHAGTDTLNAAAVTTASLIDLSPGGASRIAGEVLALAPGTRIENAHGGDGADTILGNAGANILEGHRGNDTLRGMAGDDTLIGGAGEDHLDGGAGSDRMEGGSGDDIYIVDDAADLVIERPGEGMDEVRSWISHTLPAHVEQLRLMGGEAPRGAAGSTLYGNAGNGLLPGAEGGDRPVGETGSDVYSIASLASIARSRGNVTEQAGEGGDTAPKWISQILPPMLEALVLRGTGNALDNVITGNALLNRLFGEGGDDTLDGGAGLDILSGGSGADRFIIQAGQGMDRITDFQPAEGDLVVLRGFPAAAAGAFLPAGFWLRQSGHDVLLDSAAGTALVLEDIQISALSARDFLLG
ncbi:hypothetical protein CR162_09415 [Pseudoroseomonas rhizosphaerae]|uniref:P/Homo B domain-containing protein n=1 Tax=Teichococcus rhizosphaerae TaxID=1335062 RepID=A0A2C7AC35_9PROT|nr:S8 family serine peptidase [Pseudoroseomonas rhizosphaerae]PHK95223.1 hypothetical protein CR162_09415 [Pseudoroseomonas rhizosphaerae]